MTHKILVICNYQITYLIVTNYQYFRPHLPIVPITITNYQICNYQTILM